MLKRPRLGVFAGLVLALLAYLYMPWPAPDVPPPSRGDCVVLHLWTNGYHSDLGIPADMLPPDHPLRMLYPSADTLLIGWGEDAFYHSDGRNLMMGLDAIIPPSPTVMHVVSGADAGSAYLGPIYDQRIAVSREGAARLAQYLHDALALDAQGRAEIESPGKVQGASYFLHARGSFHLFNVCNHWMARALRSAGVNVNWRDKWLGTPLVNEVRRVAPSACPS